MFLSFIAWLLLPAGEGDGLARHALRPSAVCQFSATCSAILGRNLGTECNLTLGHTDPHSPCPHADSPLPGGPLAAS